MLLGDRGARQAPADRSFVREHVHTGTGEHCVVLSLLHGLTTNGRNYGDDDGGTQFEVLPGGNRKRLLRRPNHIGRGLMVPGPRQSESHRGPKRGRR